MHTGENRTTEIRRNQELGVLFLEVFTLFCFVFDFVNIEFSFLFQRKKDIFWRNILTFAHCCDPLKVRMCISSLLIKVSVLKLTKYFVKCSCSFRNYLSPLCIGILNISCYSKGNF